MLLAVDEHENRKATLGQGKDQMLLLLLENTSNADRYGSGRRHTASAAHVFVVLLYALLRSRDHSHVYVRNNDLDMYCSLSLSLSPARRSSSPPRSRIISMCDCSLTVTTTLTRKYTYATGGKDEDDGIDPSYVDLGLFVNSEKVFEDWSNVLCTGGDNELRAIHESSKR